MLSGNRCSFKNKKWRSLEGKPFNLLPNQYLTFQTSVAANQIKSLKFNSNSLFLDLNLLNETINPKDANLNSAFSFCFNEKDVSIEIETLVLRLQDLLKKRGIILFEFNLIGGALQRILLQKEKKRGGDIDFQGYVKGRYGQKVVIEDLLDAFSQVIEEMLIIPTNHDNSKDKTKISSFSYRMKRLHTRPYVLKALFHDENFLLITIPLKLTDPHHPSQKISVDIDIRLDIGKVVSSISSANCFEYNLLPYYYNKSHSQTPLMGSLGYENSVQEAFDLFQQGLFFVNEEKAMTTLNGLRAYATLLTKGLFPTDSQSARVYLVKWVKEIENSSDGVQFAINCYFYELEKYVLRHYVVNDSLDTLALSLYFINLRSLFACHEWPKDWAYTQDEFLKTFDDKAFFLLHKSMPTLPFEYLHTLKLILFWGAAHQSERIFAIPNSNLFAFRVSYENYGMVSEIPLKETLHFDWQEWDHQIKIMEPLLEKLGLPLSSDQLKKTISDLICNPHSSFNVSLLPKHTSTDDQLIQLKTLKFCLESSLNYGQFFSLFLKAIKQNPESRIQALQELLSFMRVHHPEIEFRYFGEAINDDIPKLFEALAKDLKNSKKGQIGLCNTLMNMFCLEFRESTLPLIFPHLDQRLCEKYFQELWSAKDRKSFGITDSVFYKLLNMALLSPNYRSKPWDKFFKHKLPYVLEEAQADTFPVELVNTIGKFFNIEQSMYHNSLVNILLHLSRLGYPKEKIKNSLESCLQQCLENKPSALKSILASGFFTSQTMWELLSGELFNLKNSSILQSLSIQCWKNDVTSNLMLEEYWKNAMQQNILPTAFLNEISNLKNISEDFKRQIDIAKMPTSQHFQTKLAILFKNQKKPNISKSTIEEQWKNIKQAFLFDHNTYNENEWNKILNLIESGLENSSPHEFLPVLTDLLIRVPANVKTFKPYLVSLEENCLKKVVSTPLREMWPKLHLFTQFYLHRFPIDAENKRDDKLIDTILFKILTHTPEEEALSIFINFVQKQSFIQPDDLTKYLNTFDNIIKSCPRLYDSKKATELWENFVLKIEKIGAERISPELFIKWIELLFSHFADFKTSLLFTPLMKFSHFFEKAHNLMYPEMSLANEYMTVNIYIQNITKISNESQNKTVRDPNLAHEWELNWQKALSLRMQLEDLEKLYKIFVKNETDLLFLKSKKTFYFNEIQKLFFILSSTSITIIKNIKTQKLCENEFENNLTKNLFEHTCFFYDKFFSYCSEIVINELNSRDSAEFITILIHYQDVLKEVKKMLNKEDSDHIKTLSDQLYSFAIKNHLKIEKIKERTEQEASIQISLRKILNKKRSQIKK